MENKMKKLFLCMIVFVLMFSVYSCEGSMPAPQADGEKLVRSLWADFEKTDRATFDNWLSPAFQSVHEDKARDKEDEITLLMDLNLGPYTLDKFTSTQDGNVLIVSYTVAVHETIEGKELPGAPAGRMSVFRYNGEKWLWIAHANMNPMSK